MGSAEVDMCKCGHLRSEHGDTIERGHGGCLATRCQCTKFVWVGVVH